MPVTAAPHIPAWRLLAYGATAVPLAMAALPIYVHVPKFYADSMGLNLAAIGGLLLLARVFDAVQDPLLGYLSDLTRDTRAGRMVWIFAGTPLLALGMLGLFRPPALEGTSLTWWFLSMLVLVYLAFSMVQISYQAYGAEISDHPQQRTRVTAYREGLGLIGVFLAASLPEIFARNAGPRDGYAQFAWVFLPILAVMVSITLTAAPAALHRAEAATREAWRAMIKPLRNARFRSLLLIFVFNGIAASIPATLVLFFIEDVVRRPELSGAFLVAYFAAGAAGMPLWLKLSAAIGKGRAWLVGMVVSIVAFVWAYTLGEGDVLPFMMICVLSGFGLGADLALPPSILADVIDDDEHAGLGRNEGAYFGLWNLVTKMNLALAAGIALPLLAAVGYQSKVSAAPQALNYLAAIYALLPCLLKTVAVLVLLSSPFVRERNPA
jgi:Na+/melibiose symporter-like transporter